MWRVEILCDDLRSWWWRNAVYLPVSHSSGRRRMKVRYCMFSQTEDVKTEVLLSSEDSLCPEWILWHSSLNTAIISCMQSNLHLVFSHWKWVKYNNLHMEPQWKPHVSMGLTHIEKFIKNQYLTGYSDFFKTSWVAGMQTLWKKHEKCFSYFWTVTAGI